MPAGYWENLVVLWGEAADAFMLLGNSSLQVTVSPCACSPVQRASQLSPRAVSEPPLIRNHLVATKFWLWLSACSLLQAPAAWSRGFLVRRN